MQIGIRACLYLNQLKYRNEYIKGEKLQQSITQTELHQLAEVLITHLEQPNIVLHA
jgi:hypothetical protein